MKRTLKNEMDMLGLINKLQAQLSLIDQKMDTLIGRSLPGARLSQTAPAVNDRLAVSPHDRNKGRVMHKAVCADCKKECMIPFKPSGDRPVYCQDCFSRRKVIRLSKIGVDVKLPINIQEPQVKKTKKAAKVKKTIVKKKTVPKKK